MTADSTVQYLIIALVLTIPLTILLAVYLNKHEKHLDILNEQMSKSEAKK